MKFDTVFGLQALALRSALAQSCTNLLIDDFSSWSKHVNLLGSYAGDDNTISGESTSNKTLSFTPTTKSYFYETFCQSATAKGYGSLQFTIKGAKAGSALVELQTRTSCTASTYKKSTYTVSGLTGNAQDVVIPLSKFAGANLDAITGIVWGNLIGASTTWQFSQVQLVCGTQSASSLINTKSTLSSASTLPSPSSLKIASSTLISSSVTTGSVNTRSSGAVSSGGSISSSSSTLNSSAILTTSSTSSSRPSTSVTSTTSSSASSSTTTGLTLSSPSSPLSSATASQTVISQTTSVAISASTSSVAATIACTPLLVDDWTSQSRLTFLYYNAMLLPSSDDQTMSNITVGVPSSNHVTLYPKNKSSYIYSQFGCLNAKGVYGGLSLRIKAVAGATITISMNYGCQAEPKSVDMTSSQLGWKFDGTEQLYVVDFAKFAGLDLGQLNGVLFSNMNKPIALGPMAFYCGQTAKEYVVTTTATTAGPFSTVSAPIGTAPTLVIDDFSKKDSNAQGFWHGADEGMILTWGSKKLKIVSQDPDYSFYTQVSGGGCVDFTKYRSGYLHLSYTGTNAFTISLQQHNDACNDALLPYPATWDSLEAARYASATDIYIPMSHFKVDFTKLIGFSFHGFYKSDSVTFTKVEIVDSVPTGFSIPEKLPSGNLVFQCKRPNSFAFAIDDGDPSLAQQVLQIIKEENITVTFFTVGAPLLDPSTNLSSVYKEMMSHGHQLALHSYTHPKMEGLPSHDAIDWEYNQDIAAVKEVFGSAFHTPYFRPPFGNEGARMRQRLGNSLQTDDFYIVNWSVDVQDWLWANSDHPEKQLTAFQDSVNQGGNLVVMHYLYPSTVNYLRQFIRIAKASGKQLMRVDQCMMDPNAPPL